MLNSFSKVLGAGLMTLAVVGGTAAYLTSTLQTSPVKQASVTAEKAPQSDRYAYAITTEGPAS